MQEIEYHKMFAFEESHWWFQGKHAIVAAMMDRFAPRPVTGKILDVGCGTGGNLLVLSRYGDAYGVDLHPLAVELCARRGFKLARANAQRLPHADQEFEVVGVLDILYHRGVQDVAATLAEAYRVCRPGGLFLVVDSAFEFLKGPHDVAYHGVRRFHRKQLEEHVRNSGFSVVFSSYYNSILFPLAATYRLYERWRSSDEHAHSNLELPPAPLNRLLSRLYRLEARVLRRRSLPFGLSVLVVGRKPG